MGVGADVNPCSCWILEACGFTAEPVGADMAALNSLVMA